MPVPPSPTVSPAGLSDATALAAVHVRSWRVAYAGLLPAATLDALSVERRAAAWIERLAAAPGDTWLARRDARVVGFVDVGPCRDDGAPASLGELHALYVDPDDWGRGTGRVLMDTALAALAGRGFDAVSLWVLAGNARGIRFYEAAGFAEVPGSRQVSLVAGTPCEELAMRRPLTRPTHPGP